MNGLPPHLKDYAFHPEPVVAVGEKPVMTFEEFSRIADTRVRHLRYSAYRQWRQLRQDLAKDEIGTCSYDYRRRVWCTVPTKTVLSALDIVVNEKAVETRTRSELLPYFLVHEKWELWMRCIFNCRTEIAHLLARHHQYMLAMKDGNANKLYEFYANAASSLNEQLEGSHDAAMEFAKVHRK